MFPQCRYSAWVAHRIRTVWALKMKINQRMHVCNIAGLHVRSCGVVVDSMRYTISSKGVDFVSRLRQLRHSPLHCEAARVHALALGWGWILCDRFSNCLHRNPFNSANFRSANCWTNSIHSMVCIAAMQLYGCRSGFFKLLLVFRL